MKEKINKVLQRPLYLYLIGIIHLLYKLSLGIYLFDVLTVVCYLLVFILVTFLLQLLVKKVFRFSYSAPLIAAFWILVFFHKSIATAVQELFGAGVVIRFKYIWLSAAVAGVLFSWVNFRLRKYNASLNRFFNVASSILVLIIVWNILVLYWQTEQRINKTFVSGKQQVAAVKHPKSIVWILMDEYTSSADLANTFGFTNPLDTFLQHKNFDLLSNIDSRSYATLYSLNSIFNFDDSSRPYSYVYGNHSLEKSALTKVLQENGYRFINLSSFNIGGKNRVRVNTGYYPSLFFKLVEGTLPGFLLTNYSPETLAAIRFAEEEVPGDYNDNILAALNTHLTDTASAPVFIWAHFTITHDSYYRIDKDTKKIRYITNHDSLKTSYISYLSRGNEMLKQLINTHPVLQDKIVIVSGDHGVRFSFLPNRAVYAKRPFCAVYLPFAHDSSIYKGVTHISQLPAVLLNAQRN
jgi:hypothetical protein